MYRRLLDLGTEEAKKKYNEAKTEAKRVVRRAKNEEWVQLESSKSLGVATHRDFGLESIKEYRRTV